MRSAFLVLIVLVCVAGVGVVASNALLSVGNNQGYEPVQPIAFSHKVHAGDNGINCLYCHFAAEKGRHAGIPPTEVCMNCHNRIKKDSPEIAKIKEALAQDKPVQWEKVHHLPDHAYFNHSQHIKLGKIACQQCHGPVESMTRIRQYSPLTMGWCLDCHRKSEIAVPNDIKANTGANCSACHY